MRLPARRTALQAGPSLAGSGCHAEEAGLKVGQTFLSASPYSYRSASTGFARAALHVS